MSKESFDIIWEEDIYKKGNHLNRYPYDKVVTFIYRNFPRDKNRKDIKILEVGCGSGNNLWFAAREGFAVYGLDGSQTAIDYANKRFMAESLKGEFVVGDFTKLAYPNDFFDLVIDRQALTCCSLEDCRMAMHEIHRVLAKKGGFMFNPYSTRHTSSMAGDNLADGRVKNINKGTLVGVGQICFYDKGRIEYVTSANFQTIAGRHEEWIDIMDNSIHAEWIVHLQKI